MKIKELAIGGLFCDGDWVESKDQDPEGAIRLIQLADIGDGWFIDKSARFMNEQKAAKLRCTFLKKDDILIARMPDPIGRACLFPFDMEERFVTVVDVCVLRLNGKAVPKYVVYAVNSPLIRHQIEGQITGTTRQRITRKKIGELQIPLPPLPIQQKIAAILDAADQYRQKTKALVAKYDQLAQSLFLDMFGDPVSNPKGWETVMFSDIGSLDRGKSKHRPRNAPELLGGKYPLIQTGDVANSGGYISSYTSTYSELGLKQSKLWQAGTLCITIAANIAKTGILKIDACFPDSVVGFLPNDKTNVEFVQYWMSFLQKILEDSAPESAQKNINLKILRNLEFFCPPTILQNQFADRIQQIEQQKQQAQASLQKAEELFQSLLQRA
ncbi:MAG: restriction endonuclease subunit S, partial [Candidatus Bathyarchaeota archaeon]|nr:restriction endonuclease subunit S [Candidatus Bathyarchaeum sp.]